MNINHILVVMTEPKSIFLEILFKYFISTHFKKNKKKISIVGNISYVKKELKKNKYNIKTNEVLDIKKSKKKFINLIDIKIPNKYKVSSKFHIQNYISNCFGCGYMCSEVMPWPCSLYTSECMCLLNIIQ